MTDKANDSEANGRATKIAVRWLSGLATLILWQVVGSALYNFGTEGLRPEYHFGANQALCLIGASALSVLTAGMPYRDRKWLVPGPVLAVVAAFAVGTAIITSLVTTSVVIEAADTSNEPESLAGEFLGVLFCLVPVAVYIAACFVRLAKARFLTGVLVLAATSLTVPIFAIVTSLLGV